MSNIYTLNSKNKTALRTGNTLRRKQEQLQIVKEKYDKTKEQIEDPNSINPGSKSFGNPLLSLAGSATLMGLSCIIKGMQPTPVYDLGSIIQTDSLTASYMKAYSTPKLLDYNKNTGQQAFENTIMKLSNFFDGSTGVLGAEGINGFSLEARQEAEQKKLRSMKKQFEADIKKLQKEISIGNAQISLNNEIASLEQFPEFTMNSYDDFKVQLDNYINNKDSDISKLYTEFTKDTQQDEDTAKENFTDTLFNHVLKVKFDKSFEEIKGIDKISDNKGIDKISDNKDFINKLKNDPDYLNIVFGEPDEHSVMLSNVQTEMKSKINKEGVNNTDFLEHFMAYRNTLKANIPEQNNADNLVSRFIALNHQKSLKDSGSYDLIKEKKHIFNPNNI